jgi:hypothetical protein
MQFKSCDLKLSLVLMMMTIMKSMSAFPVYQIIAPDFLVQQPLGYAPNPKNSYYKQLTESPIRPPVVEQPIPYTPTPNTQIPYPAVIYSPNFYRRNPTIIPLFYH